MSRVAAVAVALLVLDLAAGAAHAHGEGRRITFDPARLGTPMITPAVEVVLSAQPSAVGMQCDGVATASSTHDPVMLWRLSADAPDLRVTITGAHAAIHDDDGTWFCSDAHGDVDLAHARAGDYALYVFADSDRATVALAFESPTRVAQEVAAARDRAPAVHLGSATRPNPQLLALTATRAGQARDLHLCVGDRERFTPLARVIVDDDVAQLRVAERDARAVGGHAARIALVDARGRCAAAGPIVAGTYVLWAELELDHVPRSFPIELDDASRAIAWPDAPLVDLATNRGEPIVDDGKVEAPGPWPARATARCKPLATAPSFTVVADAAQPIELRLVWQRRAQWFFVDGPGVSTCSAAGGPVKVDAQVGRYAVWVGGTPGADFHVFVHRVDAAINPIATFGTPPADLALGERVVTNFYPYFDLGADDASAKAAATALFASISDRVLVYVGAQPLALLAIDQRNARVLTAGGHVERVPIRALAIVRPAQVELPADTDAAVVQRLGAITVATAEPLPPPDDDLPVEVVPAVRDRPSPDDIHIAMAGPPEDDDLAREPLPSGAFVVEVGATFPAGSTTGGTPHDTSAQGLGVDVSLAYGVGARVQLGADLSVLEWANWPTAYLDQANHLYRADVFARYAPLRGRFRPYAMIDVGAGLSSLAPGFTVYDLGTPGTTTVGSATGLAVTYGAGLGFARTLRGPWSIVGEAAVRHTALRHSMSFAGDDGSRSSLDSFTLDEYDGRLAVAFGF